jgi:dUTP pyrophosphatase
MMLELKIFKTHPNIPLPTFSTKESACFDLSFQAEGKATYAGFNAYNGSFTRSCSAGKLVICPRERVMVPTGLILDIPEGHSVRIHPRSGLSLKKGLVLVNAEGIIDSDYVEELILLLTNISENNYTIENGERIAQGELIKSEKYSINETKRMPVQKTDRNGGVGSTGTGKFTLPPEVKMVEIS